MKKSLLEETIATVEDEFWTERLPFFTAQFPTYYRTSQQVHGRFHTSNERFEVSLTKEIIPISEKRGTRTYVMMQPYVLEPKLTLTIGLYKNPKHYADQESPIGEAIGGPQVQGFKESQVGHAQAWYYPTDKIIVVWECFFDRGFRKHPFATDPNMQQLWQSFERYLVQKFLEASTVATPFNDPIAESIEEYQTFLKTLGYSPLAEGAFGKRILRQDPEAAHDYDTRKRH
jgi:hypothetical protein